MWEPKMSRLFFWILLVSVSLISSTFGNLNENKCRLTSHKIEAANCRDLKLKEIPSDLKSSIEILDMVDNKLSEIVNSSFINYPSLKQLYLSDNSIVNIESEAFNPLQYLKVLNLSKNQLKYFPNAIFNLPMLRKLSVAENNLHNSIDIRKMAKLCSLRYLDLRNNSYLFENNFCKCKIFVKWIVNRTIQLYPEPANLCEGLLEGNSVIVDPRICFTNETELLFEESRKIALDCEVKVKSQENVIFWTLVGFGIFIVFLVFLICLCCCIKKRQRELKEMDSESVSNKSDTGDAPQPLLCCFMCSIFEFLCLTD